MYDGCYVLSLREQNLYHDSYFHATVWDDERNAPREVEYGGTHCGGWQHPEIDAPAEVLAKYEAWKQAQRDAYLAEKAACECATPTKGKRVRVVKGRKIAIGTEAEVFWYGEAKQYGPMYANGYKMASLVRREEFNARHPPVTGIKEGRRVGLLLDDGTKVFTDATNVEVAA